jgi:hypothetical protein
MLQIAQRSDDTYFLCTTTGSSQTLTIAAFTVSASCRVDWGDGNYNDYTGAGARTHTYDDAGTYTVQINQPQYVTNFQISDSKVTLNSANIKNMVNVTTFYVYSIKAGTFNSSDVSAWRPTTFGLRSMPSGYAGTFNFSDISAWRPTTFWLYLMPSGYAGSFNSSDVNDWRPTTFYLYSMPTATFSFTISAGGFDNWTTGLNAFYMLGNALTTAQVSIILDDLYTAALTRTGTAGTINLGGSNEGPAGVYQEPEDCEAMSSAEKAYELLNDSCDVITNHWATVTVN